MDRREILAGTTAAANSGNFTVDNETVNVIVVGLATTEKATLEMEYSSGNYAVVTVDGLQVDFTATNNVITVYGPGIYRVAKEVTAAAASIHTAS